MDTEKTRAHILRSLGATEAESEELIAYGAIPYDLSAMPRLDFPWPDAPYVPFWQSYSGECERAGSIAPLANYLVQFHFPIAQGMSQNEEYRAATRRAVETAGLAAATGLEFNSPETCRIMIHATPAGKIPILAAGERADFVMLVQALTERNELVSVPDSMGACMVSGYNNLHRIRLLRERWEIENPQAGDGEWSEEFSRIIAQPALYRDQFIIVSEGPYSNTPAADVGLAEEAWRKASLAIRIEHECAHFYVRRAFPGTRFQKNMHEELVADYVGIKAVSGKFRSDWFLRFIGLESYPKYRRGGRLENYRGQPPISDGAFAILQRLMKQAADNLERFDNARQAASDCSAGWALEALALSSLSLEELAAPESPHRIADRLLEIETSANHHQVKTVAAQALRPAAKEEA